MIKQHLNLIDYGWQVFAYYETTTEDAPIILKRLEDIGCRGETLKRAEDNLYSGHFNSGLTYADIKNKVAVLSIGETTSALQFVQSWFHEMGHLADYIAQSNYITPHGEELQYLGDFLVGKTWSIARLIILSKFYNEE